VVRRGSYSAPPQPVLPVASVPHRWWFWFVFLFAAVSVAFGCLRVGRFLTVVALCSTDFSPSSGDMRLFCLILLRRLSFGLPLLQGTRRSVPHFSELVADWMNVLMELRFSDRESKLVAFGFGFVSDFVVGLCELRRVDRLPLSAPPFVLLFVLYCPFYAFVFQIRVEADLAYFELVRFRKPERVWFLNPKGLFD